ncbi:Protein of unknown function [Propionibacterium freudenreichii]|nr:Protein of unknown function [Propionibacterium freudenreichii]CEG97803.1 Protein of unknown function [Propionibacterium freudenreichii]CEG98936.1 Protein of unknown function [Propionibacterium freudenreichii]
MNIQRP